MEPTQLLNLNGGDRQAVNVARWLVDHCDTVVWSNYGRQPLIPGLLRPWNSHPEFKSRMAVLREQFQGITADRLEYGYIKRPGTTFTHYSFDLAGSVRELILREGPLVSSTGLWDPCYYRSGGLVAASICHEHTLMLWTSATASAIP